MKLADTRRSLVVNEFYISPAPIGINDTMIDVFIVNAFGFLPTASTTFLDGEIIDPLVVLRATVQVEWAQLRPTPTSGVPSLPTILVDFVLIAVNDQFPNTIAPRITSTAEDNSLFVRHPTNLMRYQFNGEAVTVIKRKRVKFSPNGLDFYFSGGVAPSPVTSSKNLKISKRLRGKKEFETTVTQPGAGAQPVETLTPYLKGWNYYWVAITQPSTGATLSALTTQPISVSADRYVYYKDF